MQVRNLDSAFVWLHRVIDVIVPQVILYATAYLYGVEWDNRYFEMGLIGGFALTFFNQATGVYSNWRGRMLFAGFQKILYAWALTWMFLVVLAFLLKDSAYFSRVTVTFWAVFTPIGLLAYRFIIRTVLGHLRTKGWNVKRIAIIGAGVLGERIASTLQDARMLGYQPVAFFDDKESLKGSLKLGVPVIGGIDDFLCASDIEKDFDEVYIALPLRAEKRIKNVLNKLADSSLPVKFIPDFFSFDLLHSRLTDINGIPIVSVYDSPLSSIGNAFLKRLEDIVLSVCILLLIFPILVCIGFAIKISSNGPVLFKQRRYGINGEEITVLKFRTMYVEEDGNTVSQVTKGDSRVTPLGAVLRKTSLDELPQFFNVLAGNMSIVGPRPHASSHNEEYRKLIPKYMLRHLVKPGITGWAQINGWRGETDTLEKMSKRIEFDLHYIEYWSLWMDIKIIMLSLVRGFVNKNAY